MNISTAPGGLPHVNNPALVSPTSLPSTTEVKTEQGVEVYGADFVVDASGRAARYARLLGQRRIRYDRLVGVVAYLHSNVPGERESGDSWTLVEAVEEGWVVLRWLARREVDRGLHD